MRILVASYGAPGRDGTATASHALFLRMRRDGLDARYLALIDEAHAESYRREPGADFASPRDLDAVGSVVVRRPLGGAQPALAAQLDAIAPQVVLAVSHVATDVVKRTRPELPVVFATAGVARAGAWIEANGGESARTLLERLARGERVEAEHACERRALERADRVVAHSPLARELLAGLYPDLAGKLHPEVTSQAEWVVDRAAPWRHLARPFAERDVDVLFVASRWSRAAKNEPLLRRIVAALPGRRIHVVGTIGDVPGATCHGFLAEPGPLFDLYGRARTLVCPSRLDAEPGALFEAAALGANPVASRSVGNVGLCPPGLVVEDPDDLDAWRDAIERGLAKPLPSGLEGHLGGGGYRRLLAVLDEHASDGPVEDLARHLADPARGFAVLRGFLTRDEADAYRAHCRERMAHGRVVHARINRPDMFDYVEPRVIDAAGKMRSTRDRRRRATLVRLYQFPHNRHPDPVAEIFDRTLSLRDRIESRWLHDDAYRRARAPLRDYVQATRLLEDNHGVARHRDTKKELRFPQLQPFLLLSDPGEDFDGGEFVIHRRRGRSVRFQDDEGIRKGDLVLFDRGLEHEVEPTTGTGRSGLGRWSVVIGARDVLRGGYLDRYWKSAWWVRHVAPLGQRTRRLLGRGRRALEAG